MSTSTSGEKREIAVTAMPIELCQFLKFGGLVQSGGEAKKAIGEGRVLLNGLPETRKRKKLAVGDHVAFNGQTIVVGI